MGAAEVRFTNSTTSTLFVACMRRNQPECLARCGGNWQVNGWLRLAPGGTGTRRNPDQNRWFYYYAESANGTLWNGSYPGEVQTQAFTECRDCIEYLAVVVSGQPQGQAEPVEPWRVVGFRPLDTNAFGGVTLTE